MTKVNAIQCSKCKDVIFSRARHDYRGCTCGAVAIDGGFDYVKTTGEPTDIEHYVLIVYATRYELYQDWNEGMDLFGKYTPTEFLECATIMIKAKEPK